MTMTPQQAGEVQSALVSRGYDVGRAGVDRDYGAATHRANLAAIAATPQLIAVTTPPIVVTVPAALSPSQLAKLTNVHPDLIRVFAQAAAQGARFRVDTGARSLTEQKRLVAAGSSQTLDSRHLISKVDGLAHAGDLYPLDDVDHDNVPWDWDDFYPLAEQVRTAAETCGVPVRWGGCWSLLNGTTKSAKALVADYSAARRAVGRKPFLDGPHFELPANLYP